MRRSVTVVPRIAHLVSRMAATVLVVVGAAGAAPIAATEANDASLQDLRWMVGSWTGTAGDLATEEIWIEPKGGMMLGLHRDVGPSSPTFFEYLRIERRRSGVVYIASPRGEETTEFALVRSGTEEAVFENLTHDFPQRIIYRRQGDLMVVRIEGDDSGELRAREWEWTLSE